jgi:hypothetical protein
MRLANIIISTVLLAGCSTKTYVSNPQKLQGKRVAVTEIILGTDEKKNKVRTDTLCDCLATTVAESLYPYLQQAGMTVVIIPVTGKPKGAAALRVVDSLQLDYIVSGSGIVQYTGSSAFMHALSLKITDTKTREVLASGNFSGPAVYPAGAASRIGKKLVAQMKHR